MLVQERSALGDSVVTKISVQMVKSRQNKTGLVYPQHHDDKEEEGKPYNNERGKKRKKGIYEQSLCANPTWRSKGMPN